MREIPVAMPHRRGRRLSLAEETFLGLCRDVAEKLLHAAPGAVPAA